VCSSDLVELEIRLGEIQAQLAIAEAENTLKIAKAKYLEAQARGDNLEAAKAEIRVSELGLEAAQVKAEITAESARHTRDLASATKDVTGSSVAAGGAIGGMSFSMDEARNSARGLREDIDALTEAEQRLLDITNAANAARQQGGSTPWEYLLGKKGIDLNADQLAAFKSQIEGVYKYVSGTFDGKTVDQSYLLDEAIRRTLESVKRSAQSSGGIPTPTASPAAHVTSASGSGITIVVQGDALDVDGLAAKLQPALQRAERLRS
jgi:hypothetical protein